ncbi:MAG TPA: DUF262 domain-containing protein [Rhizomicrobium sp.]|nr:DUF262 domain-containing protein [Rhizomicrobium sp.]
MQVGTLAVQHIFEKDVHYRTPLYQRPYVWNEAEQWAPLWEDLQALAAALLEGKSVRTHFMGASVQDRPTMPPGQIETRVLIDGQQRLTTLQLLLKAFHDLVAAQGNGPYASALEKLIRNNHPLATLAEQKFKVWPTNADRHDYTSVMDATNRISLLKSLDMSKSARRVGRPIPDAYLYFSEVIDTWLAEDQSAVDTRIAVLYSAIRDNVRLVIIDLDDKDDAQLIFETLNARGTPLLSADLVKNSLLSELQAEKGDVDAAYEKYWCVFDNDAGFWREEVGRGHARRARVETFLLHSLTLLSGGTVGAGHLYTAYRDFARSENGGSATFRLQKFSTYGKIYRRLQDPYPVARIDAFFQRLQILDVTTAWPFLLALFERWEDETDVTESALIDLESYLVRRIVCRLSTRGYGEIFAALTAAAVADMDDVQSAIRSFLLKGNAESDRWPTDEEFKQAWIENPLYENLTRPRLRMLLEAMEAGLRNKFAETNSVPPDLTIEHIMPQGWQENWPLESTPANERDRIIHTIGNLTLLNDKLNPHQSNRPWTDPGSEDGGKRERLNEHSVLFLNKALVDFDDWNEARIAQRAEDLFAIAKTIWPRPNSEQGIIA